MISASTLSAPRASSASVATRLESTPPLNPRTTRSKPTLRTSLRMKPTRIRRTSSGLIRSGGKAGSVRLAGAFMPDSSQFVDGKFHPFIPQHRVRQALSAHLPEVETGDDQRLVGIFLLGDDVPVWTDRHRAAPEVRPVLVAHPVAVEEEGRQELGIGAADQAVRLRRPQPLVGGDAAPRAGGGANDHVDAFETEDVRAREVPDVFADQHARPPESGLEAAKSITGRKVPLFVEHAVGWQVHLAVDVDQLAAAQVEAGVEVAMIWGFDDRSEHHVQVPR